MALVWVTLSTRGQVSAALSLGGHLEASSQNFWCLQSHACRASQEASSLTSPEGWENLCGDSLQGGPREASGKWTIAAPTSLPHLLFGEDFPYFGEETSLK